MRIVKFSPLQSDGEKRNASTFTEQMLYVRALNEADVLQVRQVLRDEEEKSSEIGHMPYIIPFEDVLYKNTHSVS